MLGSTQHFKNYKKHYTPYSKELLLIQNILKSQPPLISAKKINNFRLLVAKAALGEYFLMQLGDNSGGLYDCCSELLHAKLEFMSQLAEFFQRKTGKRIIQVGEFLGNSMLDNTNSLELFQNERTYSYYKARLNQQHKTHSPLSSCEMLLNYNYSASIYRKLNQWNQELELEQKLYTCCKTFSLNYEQALIRLDKRTGLYYNRFHHFLCINEQSLNSTKHINYLKKIANPIAIKIGAGISIKNLIETINTLDPNYIPGRITLIPSLGVQALPKILPPLIAAVQKTKRSVLWSCDPMQGNTINLKSGIKIRRLSSIVDEIKSSFLIHKNMGSQLNGIQLEATHQNVSECLDYDEDLIVDFKDANNLMAPRLNYAQTIHVIQCIAKFLKEG